ncbi:MAG: transposase [Roseovarius sp.]
MTVPNKPRGGARVDGRRVISGILHVLRPGAPSRDVPDRYGPRRTVYNRCNIWGKSGVWLRLFASLAKRSPGSLHLIDSSIVRAHQHTAGGTRGEDHAEALPGAAPLDSSRQRQNSSLPFTSHQPASGPGIMPPRPGGPATPPARTVPRRR